ncbi:MAG: GNAT family N-acetyltransferase [Otoolea sp.]
MKLELKPWRIEDAERLADVFNRSDRSYTSNRRPTPYPVEAARTWLEAIQEKEGKDGLFCAILVDGAYEGFITVEREEDVHCLDAEIGYLVTKEVESKGIATWAVGELTKRAFEELDIVRLTAFIFAENLASKRVLEKNNYVLEGVLKQSLYKNGKIQDECIYASYRPEPLK